MTQPDGSWNIIIATPMGRQEVTLDIETAAALLTGTATTAHEGVIDLHEGTWDGQVLVCKVDLKKPLPLTVTYKLEISDDQISGTAKAGPFPASKVTGSRA
ncbi:MAG: hypothetical protein ACNYNX_00840 [Leucobacter sp.]